VKRVCLLVAALVATGLAGFTAPAQEKGFGLGVILGEPTGVSLKNWVSGANAIDAGVAWSFKGSGYLHVHADYLWHFPGAISAEERFVPYAGIGGRLGLSSEVVIGVRGSGGLAWWPSGVPLDVFAEIAPVFDLAPSTSFALMGGIGVRYFFK
jgi:hypothetical protein